MSQGEQSPSDKKCEYPQCKNAGAPCRPECIGDLATYICPYDGFSDTQGRAAEVLKRFALSAASSSVPQEHHDRILRAIDAALDEAGAPVSEPWEGIQTKLSRVGRILRLARPSSASTNNGPAPAREGCVGSVADGHGEAQRDSGAVPSTGDVKSGSTPDRASESHERERDGELREIYGLLLAKAKRGELTVCERTVRERIAKLLASPSAKLTTTKGE
jgi:hypothetical protein